MRVIKDFALLPTKVLWNYSAADADATLRVYRRRHKDLGLESKHLLTYLNKPTMELQRDLLQAELIGFKMSQEKMNKCSIQLRESIDLLKQQMCDMVGESKFNYRSPIQLRKALFGTFALPQFKDKTETGLPCTNQNAMEWIALESKRKGLKEGHSFIKKLMRTRKLDKLNSTYVVGFGDWMDENDYVHTTFVVGGANSGRVTSREPALTTVPNDKSYELSKNKKILISLRDMFVCEDDEYILHTDYSQIEFRLMAYLSYDEYLIAEFDKGADFHDITAKTVYDEKYIIKEDCACKSPKKDKSACGKCEGCFNLAQRTHQRGQAKRVNFGIAFGGNVFSLAEKLGLPVSVMQETLDKLFEKYAGLAAFRKAMPRIAQDVGYIESPFGRRRHFDWVDPRDKFRFSEMGRQAVNNPPQSTAAEITYRSLSLICRKFEKYRMRSWCRNLIYDSITIVGAEKEQKDAKDIVIEVMGRPIKEVQDKRFPFDLGQGQTWAQAEANKVKIKV